MKKAALPILIFAMMLSAILILTGCSSGVDKLLQDTANGVNKQCPMTIDSETRLDNVAALPGKTLQYNYTLVNYAKGQLTADQIASVQSSMSTTIKNSIKSTSDLKTLRDYKTTFKYVYKSSDGYELFSITVAPADYQ